MPLAAIVIVAALWLAYSNGANDNFKGVATLYGSETTTYRGALFWATLATFAGSLVSVLVARRLVVAFSGKGLVPDALAGSREFAAAVSLGAALTVLLATRIGMPTSTTHALIGGLLGAGLAARAPIGSGVLVSRFVVPMLFSPVLALVIAGSLYPGLHALRRRLGVTRETCVCLADGSRAPVEVRPDGTLAMSASAPALAAGRIEGCHERYDGQLAGISAQTALDAIHYVSAGAVCFGRALNDTPKVAAVLLTTAAFAPSIGIAAAGVAMAVGGLVHSRRVAETMSRGITDLNPGQGFTANVTTAGLVLFASNLGVPVSTTHVSCGSIFGIGLANRSARGRTISSILATWVTTLPVAAGISALLFVILRMSG